MPSYLPAMQFLEDRGLREKLMRVNVTRASSGEFDNTPLITRILPAPRPGRPCFGDRWGFEGQGFSKNTCI